MLKEHARARKDLARAPYAVDAYGGHSYDARLPYGKRSPRLGGRVVMQRTATPCTPVRFRPQPPFFAHVVPARSPLTTGWLICSARVVKLVDTRDLKSLDLTVVPVRFRSRAPLSCSSLLLCLPTCTFLVIVASPYGRLHCFSTLLK